MESGIQNSFIPRDAAQPSAKTLARSGSFLDLFVLISIVLFVASLVLGAGVFLYQQFLATSVKSKVGQLERAKAAFEPALILEMTRLDDRMRDADTILGSHIAPSVLFHTLEQLTLATVSFRSLNFETVDPQTVLIRMEGIAESVNSIALQADLFSKNGVITSPIFSNIDREQDGVHFSLTATVNLAVLRYVQLATARAQAAEQAAAQVPAQTTAVPFPQPEPQVSPVMQGQQKP